jgi:hypothetical protein
MDRTAYWVLGAMALALLAGAPGTAQPQVIVTAEQIDEPAEHDHYAVAVNGIQVVIIRTGAGHSLEHRAEETAERLGEAVQRIQDRLRQGESVDGFRVEGYDNEAAVYWGDAEIVSASRGDVTGYRRRDEGRDTPITALLVAEYWRALIEDAVFLFVNGEQPRLLAVYEDRQLFQIVHYTGMTRAERQGGARESTDLAPYFQQTLDALPEADRSNLASQYVRVIPRAFTPSQVATVAYQRRPLQTPAAGGRIASEALRQAARVLAAVCSVLVVGFLVYRLMTRQRFHSSFSVTLEEFGEGARPVRAETFEMPPEGTVHFAPKEDAKQVFDVGSAGALLRNRAGRLLYQATPSVPPRLIRQGDIVSVPQEGSRGVLVQVARMIPLKQKKSPPAHRRGVPSLD